MYLLICTLCRSWELENVNKKRGNSESLNCKQGKRKLFCLGFFSCCPCYFLQINANEKSIFLQIEHKLLLPETKKVLAVVNDYNKNILEFILRCLYFDQYVINMRIRFVKNQK